MEVLLNKSGKTFRGIRFQTFVLLVTVTTLSLNGLLICLFAPLELIVLTPNAFASVTFDYTLFAIPNTHFLTDHSFLLKDQDIGTILICAAHFVGLSIGYPLGQLVLTKICDPKCILLIALLFVSALSFGCAIVLDVFVLLLLNLLVGISTAIALGSIVALVLDWCHHSNQPFALNHLIGCRFSALAFLSLCFIKPYFPIISGDYFQNWRYLPLCQCINLLNFVAVVFLVQQSPRWLHVQGRLEQYNLMTKNFFNRINARANLLLHNDLTQLKELSNLMHTVLHPADKFSQSTGFFLWSKVIFYSLNGGASIVLQYSSDYYNTWGVQLALLAGFQLLAYLLTSCISEHHLQWSLLLCLIIAGFFSFLLMLVPLGMFYALLLQIVKLVACVCDHLTLYHLLNLPLEDAISNGYAASTPHSYSFAKSRLKLTVLAEAMNSIAKTAALFFVVKTFSVPAQSRDQIPKFLVCTACYSINLLWLISYGRVAATQQKAYQQAATMVSFDQPMPPSIIRTSVSQRISEFEEQEEEEYIATSSTEHYRHHLSRVLQNDFEGGY